MTVKPRCQLCRHYEVVGVRTDRHGGVDLHQCSKHNVRCPVNRPFMDETLVLQCFEYAGLCARCHHEDKVHGSEGVMFCSVHRTPLRGITTKCEDFRPEVEWDIFRAITDTVQRAQNSRQFPMIEDTTHAVHRAAMSRFGLMDGMEKKLEATFRRYAFRDGNGATTRQRMADSAVRIIEEILNEEPVADAVPFEGFLAEV